MQFFVPGPGNRPEFYGLGLEDGLLGIQDSEAPVHRMLKNDAIWAAVAERQGETAEELEITREKVMRGLLPAVGIARLQAGPGAMVKARSEVARMCGYYAPVMQRVDASVSAKRMVDEFEVMSDAETASAHHANRRELIVHRATR